LRHDYSDAHLALIVPNGRFESRLLQPVHNLVILPNKHPLGRHASFRSRNSRSRPCSWFTAPFGAREWIDSLESGAPHSLMALTEVGYEISIVPSTTCQEASPSSTTSPTQGFDWTMVDHCLGSAAIPLSLCAAFVEELSDYYRRDYQADVSLGGHRRYLGGGHELGQPTWHQPRCS
jgi:hypothetical protein